MQIDKSKIKIDSCSKLLKVDGIIVCKVVKLPGGELALQFKDGMRLRAGARGTPFVDVRLSDVVEAVAGFDIDCLNEIR